MINWDLLQSPKYNGTPNVRKMYNSEVRHRAVLHYQLHLSSLIKVSTIYGVSLDHGYNWTIILCVLFYIVFKPTIKSLACLDHTFILGVLLFIVFKTTIKSLACLDHGYN